MLVVLVALLVTLLVAKRGERRGTNDMLEGKEGKEGKEKVTPYISEIIPHLSIFFIYSYTPQKLSIIPKDGTFTDKAFTG